MNPTGQAILDALADMGVRLERNGDNLRWFAAPGVVNDEILAYLRQWKPTLLKLLPTPGNGNGTPENIGKSEVVLPLPTPSSAEMHSVPTPSGCAWREDERGRLIFSDGAIYAPTGDGFILVKHPTRRMIAPGIVAVNE